MNNNNKNTKKRHQPISSTYTKVNAYTLQPAKEQILSLVLFISQLILHSVFLPASMAMLDQPILYVLWAVLYITFFLMCFDYCYITCTDPCDDLLIHQSSVVNIQAKRKQYNSRHHSSQNLASNPYKTKYCAVCRKVVGEKSYHCLRCRRCSENFDHHCKYLNSCIGGKNYFQFMRLLLSTTFYLLNSIGQAIWVFVLANQGQLDEQTTPSKWGALALIVLSSFLLITVNILLCFHFYISCVRGMTTLQYLYRQTPSNQSNTDKVQKQSDEMPNKSAQMLSKQPM